MRTSRRWRRPLTLALALTLLSGMAAHADQEPLWEFGLGPSLLVLMDYRGADSAHVYPLPIPYFVYRGRFLQADRDGLKGRLFDQRLLELHISLSATPPVRDSAARSGMPGLHPTVEIGPALDAKLWHSAQDHLKLDFITSARAAITVQAPPHAIGWVIDPHLNVDIDSPAGASGWKLGLLTGPLFATARYNEYFYSVAPQFATVERPAYQASGGFAGTQFVASLTRRSARYWTGAYVRYDTLSGATFADSPLVKRNSYWSAGFAVAWMISQSSHLVEVSD